MVMYGWITLPWATQIRTTWTVCRLYLPDTHYPAVKYNRVLTALLQFPSLAEYWWVCLVLLWYYIVNSLDRKFMVFWTDAAADWHTHGCLSESQILIPKLSCDSTLNRACILLVGETWTTLLFPIDIGDLLAAGQREPEGWDEVRPLLSRKRALCRCRHVR